jgi:lipopolysaccharide transport system permease protein
MTPALLWSFTRQELVDRYAGSMLGLSWVVMQPLAMLLIFMLIFAELMGARLPGVSATHAYGTYLAAGVIPWMAFSNTLLRTTGVYVDKAPIIGKVHLSLPALPLFIALSESITFGLAASLLLLFLVAFGTGIQQEIILLPWILLTQQALALGLGMILAALHVFLRDIREFIALFLQLWFWLTPIVWVPSALPGPTVDILRWVNPVIPLIETWHAILAGHGEIPYPSLMGVAVLAFGILMLGYWLVRRLEKDIRDFL